jgi:hypothetical protein
VHARNRYNTESVLVFVLELLPSKVASVPLIHRTDIQKKVLSLALVLLIHYKRKKNFLPPGFALYYSGANKQQRKTSDLGVDQVPIAPLKTYP